MLKGNGIITPLQKRVISVLKGLADMEHFYLTGGTALAEFYLGHRRSYDLDLFTAEEDAVPPFSRHAEGALKKGFSVRVTRRFSTFVEFEVAESGDTTRLQFGTDAPFRFAEPVASELAIKVNDYTDIIVDKLLAFFGRCEPRDAIDLFFILKQEDFWRLATLSSQKDPGFDLYWMTVALEKVADFPNEIKRWPVDMILEVDIGELKDMFAQLALRIMEQIRGKDN